MFLTPFYITNVDEHESLVNQKVKPKSARAKITSETQTRRWRSVTQVTGFVTLQVSDGKEWPVQMLLQGMVKILILNVQHVDT
uniref:Uncharacterized protein n=1 Tax=Salix viminalis TaxID=40686 RepID=A0A6N2L4Y8_SALVM